MDVKRTKIARKSSIGIPWSEKYRPTTFEHTILEPINRSIFENIINKQRFPNILLYGQPGVGKTTSAINLINMYQLKHEHPNKENVIHLNASDERGIEMIRNQIYNFVRSKNMFHTGLKFVILDEVDYMTKNAQQALKCILHNSYSNVRFCLICNYICKIDNSLLNEFVCVRFNKLPENEIHSFFERLSEKEQITIDKNLINRIRSMFNSDIRSMVNFLQLHYEDCKVNTFENYDVHWDKLHAILTTTVEDDAEQVFTCISDFIKNTKYFDVHRFLKGYFRYIIHNHPEYICTDFFNIGEIVVHNTSYSSCTTDYFVLQLLRFYNAI